MPEIVEALYDYAPQNQDDLELRTGNRIEIHKHLSSDWAQGKNLDTGKEGVFPKNYVKPAESNSFNRPAAAIPQNSGPQPFDEKQNYNAPPSGSWQNQQQQQYQPPQQYQQPPPQQYQQQQPQQQQQQQQQPQQQQQRHHRFGGLAKRFGDSVVFGAGATLGSDIINKIF